MYDQLIKYLEERGIHAYFQRPGHLVISRQFPNFPSSNTFWMTWQNGAWFLSTWLPALYQIPKDQNVCEVCVGVLDSSETAIYTVGEQYILKYGLLRLSGEEENLVFEAVDKESDG